MEDYKIKQFNLNLFNGEVIIEVYNYDRGEETLNLIVEGLYEEALRLQKIFNFYDGESELSILNKVRKKKVSREMLEVIKKALEISKITKGKYDVTWGRNFLQRKKGLEDLEINCSYKDIFIEGDEICLNNEAVLIDLGSIAKGYITDLMGRFLQDNGVNEFIIDSRGDILVRGNLSHSFEIQHPREEEKFIEKANIKDCALATSGDYIQFYCDYNKSHLLGKNKVISVSVIAKNLFEADVYATAISVLNKEEREEFINNNDIKVLAVLEGLELNKYYWGD